jgi:hypothetical protein
MMMTSNKQQPLRSLSFHRQLKFEFASASSDWHEEDCILWHLRFRLITIISIITSEAPGKTVQAPEAVIEVLGNHRSN